MTDPEVEDLLRETFRAREDQAPPLSRVRRKPRRMPYAAAGLATLAVLAGAIFAVNALRDPPPPATPAAVPSTTDTEPASGWRWESSLGVQIQVPDGWAVNDWGCNMTARPTVVRGAITGTACYTEEPPGKEVAQIEPSTLSPALWDTAGPQVALTIDGVPAMRTETKVPDGRHFGAVLIASKAVMVSANTKDATLTRRILDSVRIADIDQNGCAAKASWPQKVPAPVAGKPALPDRPSDMRLCYYGSNPRLQSSNRVTADTAAQIAALVNGAKEGHNPDVPKDMCLPDDTPPLAPDLVVLADGVQLSVVFWPCAGRGVTDGTHWSRVTMPMVSALMKPTGNSYALSSSLE